MEEVSRSKIMNCKVALAYYHTHREEILKKIKEKSEARRQRDIEAGIPRPGRGRPRKYSDDIPLPPKKTPGRPPKKLQEL